MTPIVVRIWHGHRPENHACQIFLAYPPSWLHPGCQALCKLSSVFLKNVSSTGPLHPVITAGPFCKWAIYFMECKPTSAREHHYIIVVVDYFTKWAKAMPTFSCTTLTATHFFFNHVISHFGIPKQLISDHRKHFEYEIFKELSSLLGFRDEFTSPYYPQANGQVEAFKKILKTML